MKYKILVLDLDGTLTNKKKEITVHTRETLIRAQEAGVKIVLASGRPTYGIAPLAEELRLGDFEGYILSYNGGQIIDWKTKKMMYENELDPKVYPYLYECAKKNGFVILSYKDEYIVSEDAGNPYVALNCAIKEILY
jgi:HAD superfamily hydrolase (TIGR01484 family)